MASSCKTQNCNEQASIDQFCRYHFIANRAQALEKGLKKKPRKVSVDEVLARVARRAKKSAEFDPYTARDVIFEELCETMGIGQDLNELDDLRALFHTKDRRES